MSRVKVWFQFFLNFIFPTCCVVCRQGEKAICESCFVKIPTTPKDSLNILSVYEYKNKIINQLLWQLKYHHNGDVAKILAVPVAKEIKKWLSGFPDNQEIVFIPTPLKINDKRLNNHAELLANEITKYFPSSKVYSNLLIKNSKKKQAHTKNKHERILNVENRFLITKDFENKKDVLRKEFENKIVMIVDDVTTTGATVANVRFALSQFLEIPEENILAVTVAH